MSYTEWGDPEAKQIVICVHGLTRNARDFDELARSLAPDRRVLCPDVVGRGRSDWLAPKELYSYPQYLADMAVMIARATAESPSAVELDWVGSSMGGVIGLLLAAQPGTPIRRLVVNDIGPFVPRAAVDRIARYVGVPVRFTTLDEAVAYVRTISASFGPLTEAQWRHLTIHSVRQDAEGQWVFRYDPGIAQVFAAEPREDVSLWGIWDRVDCPVLVLRGAESDVLLATTAEEMTRRGPRAQLIEFAGIGHAPALMEDEQIEPIRRFLSAP